MDAIKVKEIIRWAEDSGLSFEYFGDTEAEVIGFSSLTNYKDGSITWINLKNPVDEAVLPQIRCCVIQKGVTVHPDNYFLTATSKQFFFGILKHFFSGSGTRIAERQNTYIGKDVTLGENVVIGSNCVLDGEIHIGDNTVIEHNVTILNRVSIGSDCVIHPGVVIGKDGYGFSLDADQIPQKVPHFGGVRIGDRVEIGCNSVVDRGTIDDTTIGDDAKIDSLVIVAHNSSVGSGTMVLGQTAICGSCNIGKRSYIAPHATIMNKKKVGDNSFIGMGVIVTKNVGDNVFIARSGDQPRENKDYRRFI